MNQQDQGPSFDEVALIFGRQVLNQSLYVNRLEQAMATLRQRIETLEQATTTKVDEA